MKKENRSKCRSIRNCSFSFSIRFFHHHLLYDCFIYIFQVHPWVNYESILQKCYLGRLSKLDPNEEIDSYFNQVPKKTIELPHNNKVSPATTTTTTITKPTAASKEWSKNGDDRKETTTEVKEFKEPPVQLPRFDWIQKTDYITIIFYTKPLSNPQVEITKPDHEYNLNINITYDHQTYINQIKINKRIEWPCHTKINYETGKIEIIFKKADGQIWDSYGTLKQYDEDYKFTDNKFKYTIVNKMQVNHNTCLLEMERLDGNKLTIPIGKHVRVFAKIKGK